MRYEKIKEEMTLCDGERVGGYGFSCRGTVYKCSGCGAIGCKQSKPNTCTNQAFSVNNQCLKCGAYNTMEVNTENTYKWSLPVE
jgi:hypothetical protein